MIWVANETLEATGIYRPGLCDPLHEVVAVVSPLVWGKKKSQRSLSCSRTDFGVRSLSLLALSDRFFWLPKKIVFLNFEAVVKEALWWFSALKVLLLGNGEDEGISCLRTVLLVNRFTSEIVLSFSLFYISMQPAPDIGPVFLYSTQQLIMMIGMLRVGYCSCVMFAVITLLPHL